MIPKGCRRAGRAGVWACGLLLATLIVARGDTPASDFDPLFRVPDQLVIQANFRSIPPASAAAAGAASPAPTATPPAAGSPGPTPSPTPDSTLLPARFFGRAAGKLTLKFDLKKCPTGKAVDFYFGNSGPSIHLSQAMAHVDLSEVEIAPDQNAANYWSFEGSFVVADEATPAPSPTPTLTPTPSPSSSPTPAPRIEMTMTLVPEDGSEAPPPLDFVLGDVWIMAGSPNLLATKSGAASDAPTFPTGNTPAADRLLVVTETGSGSAPMLAGRFVREVAKQTSHPSIVYVLAAPCTRVADWSPHRAANDPPAAHPFWNLLGGDARLKADHPENCALIGARGLVWWHGEWEAEHPSFDDTHPLDPYAAFGSSYQDALASGTGSDPTQYHGLLPELAALDAGPAATNFALLVIQTQACNRDHNDRTRFRFGDPDTATLPVDSAADWQGYFMPDSTWSRVRAAQANTVSFLRQGQYRAALVPSIADVSSPEITENWLWNATSPPKAFELLAARVASAAGRGLALVPPVPAADPDTMPEITRAADGLGVVLSVGRPIVTVEPKGTARFEVRLADASPSRPDQWYATEVPTPADGKLTFKFRGKKIAALRYAWGDHPGVLHTVSLGDEQGSAGHVMAPFVSADLP